MAQRGSDGTWMSDAERGLSRRGFLLGTAGAAGALALGGALADPLAAFAAPAAKGGHIKISISDQSAKDSFDPQRNSSTMGLLGAGLMYDTLLKVDQLWNVTPMLAEDYDRLQGRQDLHVQAPQGRRVPQRQAVRGRGRQVLVRAHAQGRRRPPRRRHLRPRHERAQHQGRRPEHGALQPEVGRRLPAGQARLLVRPYHPARRRLQDVRGNRALQGHQLQGRPGLPGGAQRQLLAGRAALPRWHHRHRGDRYRREDRVGGQR